MALSQREKRLLAIPVVIGAVLGFYKLLHEPLFARRAEAAVQEKQVADQLKKDQTKLAREGNLLVRKEAIVAREKVIDSWVPGKNSAALLIWYLSDAESKTGARIKNVSLSDSREVSAAQAKLSSNSAPGGSAANPDPTKKPGAAPTETDSAVMLTVIDLSLTVEGYFGQHRHFTQMLEGMPLFLDTTALTLTPISATQVSSELLGQLIQGGHTGLAENLAALSPKVEGTYHISLYFKGEKLGPDTGAMSFSEAAGRDDPFARAGVEELVQTMIDFYTRQPSSDGTRGPLPPLPKGLQEQLG